MFIIIRFKKIYLNLKLVLEFPFKLFVPYVSRRSLLTYLDKHLKNVFPSLVSLYLDNSV